MTSITLRRGEPGDAAVIAEHNVRMAAETEGRDLDAKRALSGASRALADPERGVYHVAVHEGAIVGQLLITREWSDWRDGWFWWVQSVYVVPERRGQGVYRALWEHVVELARGAGDVAGLRLYVERENARALDVYHRLGMVAASYVLMEVDWVLPPDE
ncbi:MAG: GNAT family N-acetyltransferase [Deltaproteobacteria bacterium]|nr:GNAT family N-acetyltransferase [Deltaproteobacteria bacterium]MCB9786353.1 GNAT family N-acetyltransferase [Deltaproteobacteria bacterium]